MIKFSRLSTSLVISTLLMAPAAIADPVNETVFEAMPAFESIPASAPVNYQNNQNYNDITLPGQITPDARPMQFVSQPFVNVETITLSDNQKNITDARSVAEEANADAPRSESHHSGFKIRM